MKAFWASMILFALLIGCIVLNALYLHDSADYLRQTVSSMENADGREEALADLERFWENNRDLIGLTVGFRELDHYGELITELRWAYDSENEAEFERYRSLLTDAIEELVRTEKISIGNLL